MIIRVECVTLLVREKRVREGFGGKTIVWPYLQFYRCPSRTVYDPKRRFVGPRLVSSLAMERMCRQQKPLGDLDANTAVRRYDVRPVSRPVDYFTKTHVSRLSASNDHSISFMFVKEPMLRIIEPYTALVSAWEHIGFYLASL